jgi:hypothetical protein
MISINKVIGVSIAGYTRDASWLCTRKNHPPSVVIRLTRAQSNTHSANMSDCTRVSKKLSRKVETIIDVQQGCGWCVFLISPWRPELLFPEGYIRAFLVKKVMRNITQKNVS